jgi:predicted esterase YcpF (UPF0227 family)
VSAGVAREDRRLACPAQPPTLIYLHGFRSAPASHKATALGAAVDALPAQARPLLHVPYLQLSPQRAVARVEALARESPPASVTLVGSSLGGYYATWVAEALGLRAVLINPAVHPYDDLAPYLGVQTNLYTGEDFEVTAAHFDELRALRVPRITRPGRYFLLVETGDEVLDYRVAVRFYAGAWQFVRGGGDHAFADYQAQIPAILRFAGVDIG